MGSDRQVSCDDCGASWDGRARFCGRCGHALTSDAAPAPEQEAPGRRWLIVTGALVGVVALLAGAAVVLGDLSLPRGAGDPAVSLPDAEDVQDQGLDAADREEALAPFDPDRTACAPAGCEAWRRPLDVRWARGGPAQWVVGSPVVVEDDHLVGLELESGEVRWRAKIEGPLRAREDSPVDLSWGRVLLAGDDEHVVLATSDGVQLVSQTGDVLWARSLPADGADLTWAHVTGTSVLVGYEAAPPDLTDLEDGEPVPSLVTVTVLDAADGQLRWSQEGFGNLLPVPTLADEQDLVLVEADGALVALELATGEQHYELPGGPDVWPTHAGGVLGLSRSDELPTGTSTLFDASDGTVRVELPAPIRSLLEVDGRVVAVLAPTGGSGGDASAEAVAVDADGAIVWRHPIERASDDVCCPSILELDGSWVRISAGPGASAIVADVRDGSLRTDDPLGDGSAARVGQQWQVGRHLLMELDPEQDDPGYVLRDSAGRTVEVRGEGWFLTPSSDPDIVLIASPRELVAVHLR